MPATYYDPNQIQLKLKLLEEVRSGTCICTRWIGTPGAARDHLGRTGQSAVLSSDFTNGAWMSFPISVAEDETVTVTVDRTAGPNAVLSGFFLGEAGTPPGPDGRERAAGSVGKAAGWGGYDLAGWDGSQGDVSYLPSASLSLMQGSRYQWTANTSDPRALSDPSGLTRNAGAYYDANEIQVKLSLSARFSGNLLLYAVDWDSLGRREIITVDGQSAVLGEFSEGAWVSLPLAVEAGETITITVDRTAGPNAVLSGIFLGGAGPTSGNRIDKRPAGHLGRAHMARPAMTLPAGAERQATSPTCQTRA